MSDRICECGHNLVKHSRRGCNGLDSYDFPCECPSFVEWRDPDEDDIWPLYA